MVSTFQRVFQAVGSSPYSQQADRHLPMINSIMSSIGSYFYDTNQLMRKKSLMYWYRSIPELCGFVNKVARDVTAGHKFKPGSTNSGDDVGRNRIKKSNQFSQEVLLREIQFSQVVDMLVTGEGYGWLGELSDDIIRKEIATRLDGRGIELKGFDKAALATELFMEFKARKKFRTQYIDEDSQLPRLYRYVPSTTMENVYDKYDIKFYRHTVGGKSLEFSTDELVRYTFMNVDGRPNGFTPLDALLVQLELLRFMWQNMLSIHKNGGAMDKIISFENVNPNSEAFKKVKQEFMKYKNVENRHGIYLTTGKFLVEDLSSIEEMQFKDMGLYITGLLALQWGIPRSAIPYILGDSNAKADVGGESERGYWEVIRQMQKTFADRQNTQLFLPHFGTLLEFDNRFVHRDIQKETYRMNKLDNLVKENELLTSIGKQLNEETLMDELGRSEDELKKASPRLMDQTMPRSNMMGNQPKRNLPSDGDANRRAGKRTEQQATAASRGTKPSGMGKEHPFNDSEDEESDWELEYKQQIGAETMVVDVRTFVKIYQEDKQYQQGKPPRIFLRVNDLFRSYTFKSSDFVYKTSVPNAEVEQNQVLLMNLGNNIYPLT